MMDYPTAEAIVTADEEYMSTIDVVYRMALIMPEWTVSDRQVVLDMVQSALVCAFIEGYKHRDRMV